jgi:hypothetical protein
MPSYNYRGTDASGAEHAGEVQASSRTAAFDLLARRGLTVRSLHEVQLQPSVAATPGAAAAAPLNNADGSDPGAPASSGVARRMRSRKPIRVGFHPLLLYATGVITMLVGLGVAIGLSAITGFLVLFLGWITVNAAGWMQRIDLHLRQIAERLSSDPR